jgi:hypothetical protein
LDIQKRILRFVTFANWYFLIAVAAAAIAFCPPEFVWGVVAGGLIVTLNFHLLARTLKKALTPPHLASHKTVIAKYYLRFTISGVVIFFLIAGHYVDPLGLFIGLSVVVASIMAVSARELTKLIFKEAV